MATAEYDERDAYFEKARESALTLLDNPELKTPEHPYIGSLRGMVDYAVMGIIDPSNGLLHAERRPFHRTVIITPVLKSDVVLCKAGVTVANELCKDKNPSEKSDIAHANNFSAQCDAGEGVLNPILLFPHWFLDRDALMVGSAVLHETDHAHWWHNRGRRTRFGKYESIAFRAAMEVSAYRLERQVFMAEAPDLFEEQYDFVSRKFSKTDFSNWYRYRQNDKLVKFARALAFANYMFDELGAEVGVLPGRRLIKAMRAQKFI